MKKSEKHINNVVEFSLNDSPDENEFSNIFSPDPTCNKKSAFQAA